MEKKVIHLSQQNVKQARLSSCYQQGGELIPHYWVIDVIATEGTSVMFADHDLCLNEERAELLAGKDVLVAEQEILAFQYIFIGGRGLIVLDFIRFSFGNWISSRSELEVSIRLENQEFSVKIDCRLVFEGYSFTGYTASGIEAKRTSLFPGPGSKEIKVQNHPVLLPEKTSGIKNVLFACTSNKNRSRTAEEVARSIYPEYNYRSAGTNAALVAKEGTRLLEEADLRWADVIFVMEEKHRQRINAHTQNRYCGKIINLSIRDEYTFRNAELSALAAEKINHYLGTFSADE